MAHIQKIIKSLKTLMVKVSMEEHGSFVLMGMFDCVDDTVLLRKTIIQVHSRWLTRCATSILAEYCRPYLIIPSTSYPHTAGYQQFWHYRRLCILLGCSGPGTTLG